MALGVAFSAAALLALGAVGAFIANLDRAPGVEQLWVYIAHDDLVFPNRVFGVTADR